MNLLNSLGNKGQQLHLLSRPSDITDTAYLSKYFVVSEFDPVFSGGKNSISINGSAFLKQGSEISVECVDSNGNVLFMEMARLSSGQGTTNVYREGKSQIVAIYVYGDTANGTGKLILYGTAVDGRTVKWISNISIDKTKKNNSKVRFYSKPVLEVKDFQLPILNSSVVNLTKTIVNFSASVNGFATNPPKDTNFVLVNNRSQEIDYRININFPVVDRNTPDSKSFNSSMNDAQFTLYISKINEPYSNGVISFNPPLTQSFFVDQVISNNSLKINSPFVYTNRGNSLITNINSASLLISYPYINYINTSSYVTTKIGATVTTTKQSFADVTYRNIKTFSGFVARHKVYRRSLSGNASFAVVADEPLTLNEALLDNNTLNQFYNRLGIFYNPQHLYRYWYTSSNNISLIHTPDFSIDTMKIDSTDFSLANGTVYAMVKNDSITTNRNAQYVPFNSDEFNNTSGSSYDSNFILLRQDVEYIFSANAVIEKNMTETGAKVSFYITSSIPDAKKQNGFNDQFGIKIGEISGSNLSKTQNISDYIAKFSVANDIYGTLVIVPYHCKVYLQNLSVRTFGDDGTSAESYTVRIPWSVQSKNESFEIKAELFDVNSNLIFSDLRTIQSFDPSGSASNLFVGSLSTKAGALTGSDFGGSTKTASVVFSSPLTTDQYSVSVIGENVNRNWMIFDKDSSGFKINSNSAAVFTQSVSWMVMSHGELYN